MDEENVVPIEKGKRGRRRKGDGGGNGEAAFKPPKPAELYFAVIQAFNRTPLNTLPEPRCRLAVFETEPGSRVVVRITQNDVCEVVKLEYVVDEIIWYTQHELISNPFFLFDHGQAEKCAKMWRASSVPIEEPKAVRFLTEDGYCFSRLPFSLVPDEFRNMTPTWDEFFSRMTNAQAVKAWIGSLFIPESYRQQYVWLYGRGGDGKGALQRFLMRLFTERAAVAMQGAPAKGNKHWAIPFAGKRLGIFTDFDDHREMNKGIMKSLTGDDYIFVDKKGQDGYTTRLQIKLLYTSNDLPSLSTSASDQRRIIFGEMQSATTFDASYEDRLWAEAGAFLWDCITTYSRLCPKHEPIVVTEESKEAIEGWASTFDDAFEVFLEENFELDPEGWIYPQVLTSRLAFQWPHKMDTQRAFYAWLRKTHGVKKRRGPRSDGQRPRYEGIRAKEFSN